MDERDAEVWQRFDFEGRVGAIIVRSGEVL